MRGSDEQTGAMFSYLSPDALVPSDHPLRAIRPLVNAALGERVELQHLLNLTGQTVETAAHVGRSGGEPDPRTRRQRDHPRSAATTRRSATRLTSAPTRRRLPSGSSISIWSAGAVGGFGGAGCIVSAGRDLAVGAALATCTGRNDAGGSGRNVPRRTCARQFHSNPRLTSLRSATCAKQAPGSSASATILSLSAMLHRRRRSRPVMISIRPSSIVLTSAPTIARKITSSDHVEKACLTPDRLSITHNSIG